MSLVLLAVSSFAITPAPDWSADARVFGAESLAVGDFDGDGDDELVVVALDDAPGPDDEIRVYLGDPSGLNTQPSRLRLPRVSGVAALDANGDGYDDLVVVYAPGVEWQFDLHLGSPMGLDPAVAWSLAVVGDHADDWLVAADFNGDGLDDLAVSSASYAYGSDWNRVYMFQGEPGGLSPLPVQVWAHVSGYFGLAVGATDLNGDGFSDLMITWSMRVEVYNGGPQGPSPAPDYVLSSPNPGDVLGLRMTGQGDIDGDGIEDLAMTRSTTNSGDGLVVVYGSIGPLPPPFYYPGRGGNASLAFQPDHDGDGDDELVIGFDRASGGRGLAGVAQGSPTGPTAPAPGDVARGTQAEERCGQESISGDFNGDGAPDFGTYCDSGPIGTVNVYLGGP